MFRFSALLVFVLASMSVAAVASAQQAPVPPPPGIDDAGVKAAPPPAHSTPEPAASSRQLKGIPALPAMGADQANQPDQNHHGNQDGRDARGEPPPTVDVRSVGKDKVEEYRINGRLYMIHVVPAHGIPQTYMADSEGELQRQPGQPPVKPVYYTIYKWGKPKSKSSGGGK